MNRNYKILVVDDEQAILSMVKMHLELEGYLVMTATEGREALTQLSNARLLNFRMLRILYYWISICRG